MKLSPVLLRNMAQKPPIRIEAPSVGTSKKATFIFLHGYGDDGEGWINIAQQFHSANKLPYLSWIFPTAPLNHEAMTNAWYPPPSFSPIPVGRSSSSSDAAPEPEEDEQAAEILKSVEYISDLIDEEVANGVERERVIVGGFSQGCAVSLVLGLSGRSRWRGELGGVVGLSGYLPHIKSPPSAGSSDGDGVEKERKKMEVFLAHGTKDMLVPMRVFRESRKRVEKEVEEGRKEGKIGELVVKEYEGMGHSTCGGEFRDLCEWLEGVLGE